MRCGVAVCVTLLSVLAAGCGRSPGPQGDGAKPTTAGGTATAPGGDEAVAEFLASREVLQHVFRDGTGIGSGTTLQPHFLDWVALGVDEPFEQRLALALVMITPRRQLRDGKYFREDYPNLCRLHLGLGAIGGNVARKMLRDSPEQAKALLTIGDGDLASDVRRKLITSVAADMGGKGFDAELAGFAARTLALLRKAAPPEFAGVHAALRQDFREALAKQPDIAESLRRNTRIAADVRASHERVGKLIREASGG